MIIASFFTPREDRWNCDYDALLRLLDASCARLGLMHVVISDEHRPGLQTFECGLPDNLMAALLDGQRQFLEWATEPVLFVGADCLIVKDPRPILNGDMTITIGPFSDCEMNTGAIWCRDGQRCAPIWRAALGRRPEHWGEDQTSLYHAIQNSPDVNVVRVRCEDHNWAPESITDDAGMPTVAHFRGRRKAFMPAWAARHLDLVI